MTDETLPPDLSDWLHSQEFVDKYHAYVAMQDEDRKKEQELKIKRDVELEAREEQRRKLREEYEASPAYKIELEIKKLKDERSLYIKKYIQPLHDALREMGAQCVSTACDCCDDGYWND